eukprot:jgi/Astpho2/4008/Aster-x0616
MKPDIQLQMACDRLAHITELTSQVKSSRQSAVDQNVFEAPFSLVPPLLSVSHAVRHKCVDRCGSISLPELEAWDGTTSRLAAVVQQAYAQMTGQPMRSSHAAAVAARPAYPQGPGPAGTTGVLVAPRPWVAALSPPAAPRQPVSYEQQSQPWQLQGIGGERQP